MTVTKGLKAQAVQIKEITEDKNAGEGVFEALVAVFNNVDAYGDVILKGAFEDTLRSWEESGDPIPVVWSHDKNDPFSHIGAVAEAKETETGLWVRAVLDLENPKAAQVHRLLKGRRVREFSFAFSYDPEDVSPAKRDGVEVRELKRLQLFEVGPTLIGANPATQLLSVKSEPEEVDELDRLRELAESMTKTLSEVNAILGREADGDAEDKSERADTADDASRSQSATDEAPEGKSGDGTADRSADEQKQLAADFAAFINGGTDV